MKKVRKKNLKKLSKKGLTNENLYDIIDKHSWERVAKIKSKDLRRHLENWTITKNKTLEITLSKSNDIKSQVQTLIKKYTHSLKTEQPRIISDLGHLIYKLN